MNRYNKLGRKLEKRIGLKAVSKDDGVFGTIDDFNIETIDEGTPESRLTVNYIISFGDYKRMVNENLVIILM